MGVGGGVVVAAAAGSLLIYALVSEGLERMTLPVGRNGSSGSRTGVLGSLSRGRRTVFAHARTRVCVHARAFAFPSHLVHPSLQHMSPVPLCGSWTSLLFTEVPAFTRPFSPALETIPVRIYPPPTKSLKELLPNDVSFADISDLLLS